MLNRLMDLIFPQECMVCNSSIEIEYGICSKCRSTMVPSPKPSCDICGIPIGTAGTCINCLNTPPAYDRIVTAYKYEGIIKDIIHLFKYRGKTTFKKFLGSVIHEIIIKENISPDIITFIPMHWTRLISRGYNHSALIAKETAKLSGKIKADFNILRKLKKTAPQTGLTSDKRKSNIKGSFAARNVKGLKVLVIDDVITTGATAGAVAGVLKKAGADSVYIAGIGRTMPW